ncbi:MAG: CaiB/BaiF CoA transferase family protein [Candidatus Binataceae bacterium]
MAAPLKATGLKTTAASSGPFSGIRVIEYGQGVSAAVAAKFLADLGADVIKIEPPGGDVTRLRGPFFDHVADPEHSGIFLYLNANKRGAVLDLFQNGDRDVFGSLLERSDILIHNVPPVERAGYGLSSPALCARFPHLIVTSISPYGDSGARADYRGYDLNVVHSSGFAAINPGCSPYPDLAPTKLPGQQSEFQAGAHAALVALAAWLRRTRTGAGQAIDVSAQECFLSMLGSSLLFHTYAGTRTSRLGVRAIGPWMAVECADGKLYLACIEEHQWLGLVKLLGDPEWGHDEIFKDRISRAKHVDAMRMLLEDVTRQWPVRDLYHAAQKLSLPVAPVNRMADVYGDEQLRARNFFVPIPHDDPRGRDLIGPGIPYKFSAIRSPSEKRAPHLGEHDREIRRLAVRSEVKQFSAPRSSPRLDPATLPLSGIHVLDFSWIWAGPFCTMQLAQLGADVIRIESARRPCLFRALPPYADNIPGLNRAALYNQLNQGKRSVALDLSNPKAADVARKMVPWADVVVENFVPGVIQRLGLGYESLRAIKPDLVMLSISGYGQTGPYRKYVSYGGITGAQSGFYAYNGPPGDEPRDLGATYADPAAGINGAVAILQALVNRALTGAGQYIDLSMLEVMESIVVESLLELSMNGGEPERMGNRDLLMAPHNCYKAAGDAEQWVSIAVGNDAQWPALCAAMDQPELASDPRFNTAALRKRHEDELDQIITRWTHSRDRWAITQLLQRAGVAAFPTMSNRDLADDPHLIERGFIVEVDHPEVGRRKHTAIPWHLSATPNPTMTRAPLLGEDTDAVLQSVFGYCADEVEELRAQRVLF